MKERIKRVPITARISEEAHTRLMEMVSDFVKKARNTNEASTGKIIEILLLREDAQQYVEERIFR